ncbi:MAG: family 16 glycosylhydrolase, partial [Clostridia bacterium]|nr:family 16 glycosylhydrolase [Clostridia bacterium]
MKTILQKAFALFLGVAIAVSLTACGGTEDVWSEWIDLVEVSDESTSSEEAETPSSEEQTTTEVSSPVSSRPVSAGSKTKATALHITVKEKSAYKIVASLSNEGYDEGRLLQKVIRATSKASVPMILDTEDKTGLEIVIGDTTREISQTLLSTLKENEYAYRADEEGNIAIVGSNATALTMGVEDFLKTYFGYDKNATAVGKESAVPPDLNVKKSVFSEYKLVWNDEFDGNQIDGTKWCFKPLMSAQPHLQLRSDESAVKVENGAVNLMSGRISSVDYYTNTALTTADTMVFKYGLLEMRAKVPFGRPAFPSFWLQSSAHGAQTPLVMGEIDIFEHFGTEDPYIQTG